MGEQHDNEADTGAEQTLRTSGANYAVSSTFSESRFDGDCRHRILQIRSMAQSPSTKNENMLYLLHVEYLTNQDKWSLLRCPYSCGSCAGRTSQAVMARNLRARSYDVPMPSRYSGNLWKRLVSSDCMTHLDNHRLGNWV